MQSFSDAAAAIMADTPKERAERRKDHDRVFGRSKYQPHIGQKQREKGLRALEKARAR